MPDTIRLRAPGALDVVSALALLRGSSRDDALAELARLADTASVRHREP